MKEMKFLDNEAFSAAYFLRLLYCHHQHQHHHPKLNLICLSCCGCFYFAYVCGCAITRRPPTSGSSTNFHDIFPRAERFPKIGEYLGDPELSSIHTYTDGDCLFIIRMCSYMLSAQTNYTTYTQTQKSALLLLIHCSWSPHKVKDNECVFLFIAQL